jgi:hypothetical protein
VGGNKWIVNENLTDNKKGYSFQVNMCGASAGIQKMLAK